MKTNESAGVNVSVSACVSVSIRVHLCKHMRAWVTGPHVQVPL